MAVERLEAPDWPVAVGPLWVEVDLDAIADNVRTVLGLLSPGCRLLAVVKANAYGHGAAEVGRTALAAGAAGLGVSTVAEGLALRAAGIEAPVLAFTPARRTDLTVALRAGLTVTVASLAQARDLAAAAAAGPGLAVAHLKCDTGMGRYGFTPDELAAAAPALAAMAESVRWEGVYTHFPRGADPVPTRHQLSRFLGAVGAAERGGLRFAIRHAAASAAAVAVPEARLDMVRAGNLLYGDRSAPGAPAGLRRAFSLRVEPAQVRELPAGATVGYGSERRLRRVTRVAVLPVGFADGLDMTPAGPFRRPRTLLRALARAVIDTLLPGRLRPGLGAIEMGGRSVRVLGRVGMQQITVDCVGVPGEALERAATVHVRPTAVGAHVARVYRRDGRVIGVSSPVAPVRAGAAGADVQHVL